MVANGYGRKDNYKSRLYTCLSLAYKPWFLILQPMSYKASCGGAENPPEVAGYKSTSSIPGKSGNSY
jgi:hypothetical protein